MGLPALVGAGVFASARKTRSGAEIVDIGNSVRKEAVGDGGLVDGQGKVPACLDATPSVSLPGWQPIAVNE
jgi:hypothetical protein